MFSLPIIQYKLSIQKIFGNLIIKFVKCNHTFHIETIIMSEFDKKV
ncbi:hypothetical protein A1OE_178 [Candidatus Endolissoclinum faulkneri L2]|uniref:Uncharacterized protein n=1 Tax=Candidatus Endolissoclinum faulkneri L2 TaxID=1193729 RepID=K7YFM0_9PROT|nr:hypothetical protein A1OE_178 [Candidatus Endolissoclinum faulkneri L2]